MTFLMIIFLIKAAFTWLYELQVTDADIKEMEEELSFDIKSTISPSE
jgi:hypothetical protein